MNKDFWIVALMCIFSLFPFLGESHFHTRGEPREALVAQAMTADGNWTLPVTNGTDLAYKPPLMHWAIACLTAVTGETDEATSRMPSAIALAVMTLATFAFYARRRGMQLAMLTALVTLTNFEVHRAGVACRVDMLLTACMVLALFALYRWTEREMKGVPWMGILALSGAFLTKGPVGVVLPCAVAGVYGWMRGKGFVRMLVHLAGVALASCLLPALWYVAAWRQGGEPFLQLVLEENVLRFLGKMTYASHENPWPYNVMTVLTGFVPYTLLMLFSLFALRWAKPAWQPKRAWNGLKQYIKGMDDTRLYSLLCIVIIFVFYCIPKSKRSVYLLPIYPFIAYFIAEYIVWMARRMPRPVKWFNGLMAGLCVALTAVFVVVRTGLVPDALVGGKAENLAYLRALETLPLSLGNVLVVLTPAVAVWVALCKPAWLSRNEAMQKALAAPLMAFALFFALDGVYQPTVLNVKSNRSVAIRIKQEAPGQKVYSYITRMAEGNRLHPFTMNFYMDGQIVPFIDFAPTEGILLLGEKEYEGFMQQYGRDFTLTEWTDSRYKSNDNREWTRIYSFKKKEMKGDERS